MEPSSQLLSAIQLKNALTISFYDHSKPLVTGRWQVRLLISLPIPIEHSYFDMCEKPREAFETMVNECGPQIAFRMEKVRNFIAASEKELILEALKEDFIESNLEYLENPNFSRRYVLKRLEEVNKEQYCRKAHSTAISMMEKEN
jgi:hypothetical protein